MLDLRPIDVFTIWSRLNARRPWAELVLPGGAAIEGRTMLLLVARRSALELFARATALPRKEAAASVDLVGAAMGRAVARILTDRWGPPRPNDALWLELFMRRTPRMGGIAPTVSCPPVAGTAGPRLSFSHTVSMVLFVYCVILHNSVVNCQFASTIGRAGNQEVVLGRLYGLSATAFYKALLNDCKSLISSGLRTTYPLFTPSLGVSQLMLNDHTDDVRE